MKKIIPFLFVVVLFACNEVKRDTDKPPKTDSVQASIDSSNHSSQQDTVRHTDPILDIRSKVTHINTTKLSQWHFEFKCDEIMKIDVFKEKEQVVKIIVDYGTIGDVYAREEYYYDANKLIFCYEFVEGGPACEGCIKKNEYRSYILADRVIKYMKDQKVAACRRCEFGPTSKPYLLLKASTTSEFEKILCK